MRLLILTSILGLMISNSLLSQNDGDLLFDNNVLHEIRFESDDPNFFVDLEDTWVQFSASGDIPYLQCKVIIDGNPVDSVGLRIKGGLSAFNLKRPLKIDFNEFVANKSFDGIKKLNLHNGDFDKSTQRESLSYRLLRKAGIKAPRTAFAQIWINNELHGVYTMTEQINKDFLNVNFADDSGTLYKNKVCAIEVASGDVDLSHYDDMLATTTISDDANFVDALESSFSTDNFLRFFLVQKFINATDNAIDVDCNYYIYHEPKTDLLYWIPWDFNYALYDGVNYELLTNTVNVVFNRMLETDFYRERYLQLACDFFDYLFVEDAISPFIDQNAALLRDAVEVDPRYDFTIDDFDADQDFLKTLMGDRITMLQNDFEFMLFVCNSFVQPPAFQELAINEFMASSDSLSMISDPAGGFPDWVELYNNTDGEIDLSSSYLSHDKDFLKHWKFPEGTTLASDEYLIIWMDKDLDQEGLHADFKLEKDGGQIFLSLEDETLLDSINYGQQTTNIAFARRPNGTGDFIQQAATFASNNEGVSALDPFKAEAFSMQLFPNPSQSLLNVNLDNGISYSLRLLTIEGKIIYQRTQARGALQIDIEHLHSGPYMISVQTERGHETRLFSKQ